MNVVRARAYRMLATHNYPEQQIDRLLAHRPTLDRQLIDDGTFFAAWLDGQIVGGGGWSFRATLMPGRRDDRVLDPTSEAARIRSFFVDPDVAGQGIGQRLLATCERALQDAGFHRILLIATRTGEALYRRADFHPVLTVDVPLPGGPPLPCTLMAKTL